MRFGLILGPGSHHKQQLSQLSRLGHEVIYARYFPRFEVGRAEWDEGTGTHREQVLHTSAAFDARMRILHAIRNRTSYKLLNSSLWQYASFSKKVAEYFKETDATIAYSMVALEAQRLLKKAGVPVILEVPCADARTANKIREAEIQRFAPKIKSGLNAAMQFTSGLNNRTIQEYEEAEWLNAMSDFGRGTLTENGIPHRRVTTTPLGLNLSEFLKVERNGYPKEQLRILFAGRADFIKGFHHLLLGFHELNHTDAELHVAGLRSPELDPLIAKLPMQRVTFLGHLPFPKLLEAYAQADVFAFPSLCDGWGLVILEAMASGLPVITTHNTGAPHFIKNGHNGFLIPVKDPIALAEKLEYMLKNPEHRMEMGRNARETVRENYTSEAYGLRLEKLLSVAAAKQGPEAAPEYY